MDRQGADSFLPPVAITWDARRRHWILLQDYSITDLFCNVTLTVRQGFTFDLASVPRVLWTRIAPFELSIVAPLFHDALYRHGGESWGYLVIEPETSYTRNQADSLFLDHMKAEGIGYIRRHIAYYTVKILGTRSWRKRPIHA